MVGLNIILKAGAPFVTSPHFLGINPIQNLPGFTTRRMVNNYADSAFFGEGVRIIALF
ncbi:MAG: hypothetical protein ABW185_14985 [Sedimenticola sp.]